MAIVSLEIAAPYSTTERRRGKHHCCPVAGINWESAAKNRWLRKPGQPTPSCRPHQRRKHANIVYQFWWLRAVVSLFL